METIRTYLENLFSGLSKTEETAKLKNDLLISMEEKYLELKQNGKSENEAIGIVISEFGNIDELLEEMGLDREAPVNPLPTISREELDYYLYLKEKAGKLTALGAFLCIVAPAVLILFIALSEMNLLPGFTSETGVMTGLIGLLLLIAPAVGMFIYADNLMRPYQYLEQGVHLSQQLDTELRQRKQAFWPTFSLSQIVAIGLIILSPITIFTTVFLTQDGVLFGVSALLLIVGLGAAILIYFDSIKNGYEKLLGEVPLTPAKQKHNKVVGAVSATIWPVAVCIFLVTGLVFQQWHINWIVFPITGILFGGFCALYEALTGKENS